MSRLVWRNGSKQPVKMDNGLVMLDERCCCICGCTIISPEFNGVWRYGVYDLPCVKKGLWIGTQRFEIDDICVISPVPPTVHTGCSGSDVIAEIVVDSGFVLAATDGALNGCCNTAGWSITIGENTASGGGQDYTPDEYNAICEAGRTGIRLRGA